MLNTQMMLEAYDETHHLPEITGCQEETCPSHLAQTIDS